MPLKKILVPLDFSDGSLQALDYAIDLGRPVGAQLTCLYVVEPVYYATAADIYGSSTNLSALFEEQQRIGREQLASLGQRLERRKVKWRAVLACGVPYQIIREQATELNADLIVMSTHGRTGVSHLLIGSVTEKVVRSAPCPVLTIRMQEPSGGKGKKPKKKRA